jgi:hypothetical protein
MFIREIGLQAIVVVMLIAVVVFLSTFVIRVIVSSTYADRKVDNSSDIFHSLPPGLLVKDFRYCNIFYV